MTQRKVSTARKTRTPQSAVEQPSATVHTNKPPHQAELTPEQVAAARMGRGPLPAKSAKKVAAPKAVAKKVPTKAPAKKAAPPPKPKKAIGRPSIYTQELADEICALLAEGKSMRTVCHTENMPAMATVFRWLRTVPEFREQYTHAKEESADALVEEMTDISDDGRNDWMEVHDKDGECIGYKVNGEHVQRSRLRVETRKWIAAKLKPKKYSEKLDVNHGVQPDNPLAAMMSQLSGKTLKPGAVLPDDKGEDE